MPAMSAHSSTTREYIHLSYIIGTHFHMYILLVTQYKYVRMYMKHVHLKKTSTKLQHSNTSVCTAIVQVPRGLVRRPALSTQPLLTCTVQTTYI